AHVGEIRPRALGAEHRRILERVVSRQRRPTIRTVHRQVTHELRVTEPTAFTHVDLSPALLFVAARLDAGQGREGLLSQRGQYRDQEREHEEHEGGHRHDGSMVRMQPAEVHAGLLAATAATAGASARRGRMAQTLTAKTTWLLTMSRPPTVRQSHIGSAA